MERGAGAVVPRSGRAAVAVGIGVGTGVEYGAGGRLVGRALTVTTGVGVTGEGPGVGVGADTGTTTGGGGGIAAGWTPPALTRWTASAASAAWAAAMRRMGTPSGRIPGVIGRVSSSGL